MEALVDKRVKGLLNRLSEGNIASIGEQVEALFREFPRAITTASLSTQITSMMTQQVGLLEPFVILNVGLIHIVCHAIGVDLLAHFVVHVIQHFDTFYASKNEENMKALNNLTFIISFLYIFQLISSKLLQDLVMFLLAKGLTEERNLELVLKLLKYAGHPLRQDDPVVFRDLVAAIHEATEAITEKSSRLRFMLDILEDLKSNKRKLVKGDSDLVLKWKKTLRDLVRKRGLPALEPLRISLEDALRKDANNKWLVTGFARTKFIDPLIHGNSKEPENKEEKKKAKEAKKRKYESISDGLVALAEEQKMNTDIRKAIFILILSSQNDAVIAFENLLQLKLTNKQSREIPKVLQHCCGNEYTFPNGSPSYNPYYGELAEKLVRCDKDHSLTFMYCLWDTLKDLKSLAPPRLAHLAQFYGFLLGKQCIQFSALKVVSFEKVKTHKQLDFFLCVMMTEALSLLAPDTIINSLNVIHSKEALAPLEEGLQFFFTHHYLEKLEKLNLIKSKRKVITERVKTFVETLDTNSLVMRKQVDDDELLDYNSFDEY